MSERIAISWDDAMRCGLGLVVGFQISSRGSITTLDSGKPTHRPVGQIISAGVGRVQFPPFRFAASTSSTVAHISGLDPWNRTTGACSERSARLKRPRDGAAQCARPPIACPNH
jgi:hypothetical protein